MRSVFVLQSNGNLLERRFLNLLDGTVGIQHANVVGMAFRDRQDIFLEIGIGPDALSFHSLAIGQPWNTGQELASADLDTG